MEHRLSSRALPSRGLPRRAAAVLAAASAAVGMGVVSHGVVAHADDSIYECNQYGGHNVVLEVNHTSGAVTPYTGTTTAPIQAAIDQASGNVTPATSSASGAGDTVIVCQGTYRGNISIGVGNDNLTVRSEEGPSNSIIVGDGSAPVVSADDRGLSFGGPAEGLTIEVAAPAGSAGPITGIQLGVPGAQATSNEDEQCALNPTTLTTSSGCDQAAPADVTINDQIIDNIFTKVSGVTSAATITGIQLDNTINSVVQQNLITNVTSTKVASVAGIAVGGFGETAPKDSSGSPPQGYTNGDSTNINAALFQNAVQNVLQGSGTDCTTAQGIQLNGFLLDAQVYNNWEQQFLNNAAAKCSVTGIFSNAYGYLENEQTGTLVETNANIDNNTIQQLNGTSGLTSGVVLAPTPANANPGPAAPPATCVPQLGQNCNDTIPPSAYTVEDNELQGLSIAVHDEAVLGANSFIRFDNFDGDRVGVENDATAGTQNTALDATNNWWGCELPGSSGPPSSTTTNNHGCAALVDTAGDTSWAPPQTSRVEQAGDEAGDNAGQS